MQLTDDIASGNVSAPTDHGAGDAPIFQNPASSVGGTPGTDAPDRSTDAIAPDGTADAEAARFRYAFGHAPVPLALVGLKGQFLCVNPALCQLLGYTEAELLTRDFQSLVAPGDAGESPRTGDGIFDASQAVQAPRRYLHKSGREIWAVVSVSVAHDAGGEARYLVTHLQDVSAQRQAERLDADRRQVLEMVAQDRPLPAVLHQLIRLLERQLPGMCACAMLLQDGSIRPFGPSLPPEMIAAIGRRPVSFVAQLVGQTTDSGGISRMADIKTDPALEGFRDEASQAGFQSCWVVPVNGNDGIALGLLVIYSRLRTPPAKADAALLETALRLATIAIEHHQTTRRLAHLVHHDPLTGLPNRILFENRLHHALTSARRTQRPVGLLAIDLNRFKQVNDTLGHQAGDSLLQQFALRLRSKLRESDTLARVGGDEFVLLLPNISGHAEAEMVVKRITDALAAAPFEVAGQALYASGSIGIAISPTDGDDPLLLQRAADAAMYRVKEQGRQERTNATLQASPSLTPVCTSG